MAGLGKRALVGGGSRGVELRGWERKRRVLVVAVEGFGERMLVDTTIHLVVKPFSTSTFVSN